jgi:serine/threonine-protein kinase
MLTGQPPHLGGSAQQIIMKIIAEPVQSVTTLRKSVPPNVAAAVAKSLEKLPADRFDSAKAFGDALGNPAYANAGVAGPAGYAMVGRRGVSMRVFAITVAVLAAVAIVAAVWDWRAAFREQTGVAVRFPLTLAPDIRVSASLSGTVTISPDGRTVVFQAVRGGVTMLYSRELDDSTVRAIPGTENAGNPFFSHDGRWVGFFVQGQLCKVQLGGGAVILLGNVGIDRGATWTSGDVIVVATVGQMLAVPATGGSARPVAPLDTARGETSQRWPLALDDAETVLFTSFRAGNVTSSQIGVASLAKGTTRLLDLPGSTAPLAVIDGKLIYVTGSGTLMAVPFDARRARITGLPMPVGDGVKVNNTTGGVSAAISRSGSLVYQSGTTTSQLVLADLQGRATVLTREAKRYNFPRFSPDGKQIAVAVTTSWSNDVWIYDIASGTSRRLTSDGSSNRPEWTPDGKKVLFTGNGHRDQKLDELWWQPADGSAAAERLQRAPGAGVFEGVISPDGHILAYRINSASAPNDLWYRRLDGDTTPKPIAVTPFAEYAPRFSPDGRWVAYSSNQSGTPEVYVQAFPALGAPIPVTAAGGQTPIWGRDGRHIYYVANNQINVATVATTPTFAVGPRQELFAGAYALDAGNVHANFDLAPDGQHFLLLKPTSVDAPMIVVHDWKYELRARTARAAKK